MSLLYSRNVSVVYLDWRTILWNGLLHLPYLYRGTWRISGHSFTAHATLRCDLAPACSDCVGNRRRRSEHGMVDRTDILGNRDYNRYFALCILRARVQAVLL